MNGLINTRFILIKEIYNRIFLGQRPGIIDRKIDQKKTFDNSDQIKGRQLRLKQRILIKDSFIRRILSGIQISDDWVTATASTIGIPLNRESYVILAIRIEGYGHSTSQSIPLALQELDVARAAIEHAVDSIFEISYFHHNTPDLAIAIVSPDKTTTGSSRLGLEILIVLHFLVIIFHLFLFL
jgi:hypothetical protein